MAASENWAEIGRIFFELSDKSPSDRALALKQLPPHQAAEVVSLLGAHDSSGEFLEKPLTAILSTAALTLERIPKREKILHFEILDFLGEGSLAQVYLARDLELERLVALKICVDQNEEAKTLAHFSIEGIVQIYSEHISEWQGRRLRLICMQYVPGPTLATIQDEVGSAASFAELLERYPKRFMLFDPTALKWRDHLAGLAMPEAIVLMGIRIGEILEHAHAQRILHLDIKPANILIDPYGRPFLSDFNISSKTDRLSAGHPKYLGGTPHYMPPEQEKLFAADVCDADYALIDERADIYALGIMLKDLLKAAPDLRNADFQFSASELNSILDRATEPTREKRYRSAESFYRALGAWLKRRMAASEMPYLPQRLHWIFTRPLLALFSLTVGSQIVASFINISYNRIRIVSELSQHQRTVFYDSCLVYNLVSYPLAIFIVTYAMRPLFRNEVSAHRMRQVSLQFPRAMFWAVAVGWLPGTIFFPWAIDHFAGPISGKIYQHFAISFSLAWLVSVSASLAVGLFVLTRTLYPKYWNGSSELASRELKSSERLNRSLTLVSGLVPMFGALLAVLTAPTDFSPRDYQSFRILVSLIIGLGMAGLVFTQRLTRYIDKIFWALQRERKDHTA